MAEPSVASSAMPERLGRYQVLGELGRGFSSIVYEAADTASGGTVALKVLTVAQTLTPARRQELSERFEREARAVSALSHPTIVSILDVGRTDDGREYIAMERLQGQSLRERIERFGPLLRVEAVPLAIQIADALQYAHGRGIIHRDIKPDNIFLCADGTVRLMDFGIAHVFADDGLTQTGTMVGSPAYMSPEQINGLPLDGRTDVFSLAVTLTEALTGRRPFDAANIPAVMHKILNQPPQLGRVSSPAVRKALARALAKNVPARTPSAGAFAEALRRVTPFAVPLETVTGTQVMPRLWEPERGFEWPTPWQTAGLAAAALAVVTLVSLPFVLPAHRQAEVAPRVAALPGEHIYQVPSHWTPAPQTRAVPQAVASQSASDQGIGKIIEDPTAPSAAPPPPLKVLDDLRDGASAPVATPDYSFDDMPPTTAKRHARPVPLRVADDAPPTPEMAAPDTAATLPQLLSRTSPRLPVNTPFRVLPADVGLLISVNQDGNVDGARITQSSGDPALDAAAIADVMDWKYTPATHEGRAVPANVADSVHFSL